MMSGPKVGGYFQGFAAVGGRSGLVAFLFQVELQQLNNVRVVVNHENLVHGRFGSSHGVGALVKQKRCVLQKYRYRRPAPCYDCVTSRPGRHCVRLGGGQPQGHDVEDVQKHIEQRMNGPDSQAKLPRVG